MGAELPGPTAVVLAGGGSRRWGGRDKTTADLDGRPVLAHVVGGLPAGMAVIVVGPPDHPIAHRSWGGRPVRWTRETPPGGGPVAGLAAGLAALPADVGVVVVLAGDLPFCGSAVPRLLSALLASPADAVVGVDPDGRRQPLLAAYRVTPLRAAVGGEGPRGDSPSRNSPSRNSPRGDGQSGDGPRGPAGRSLRSVLAGLRVDELPVSAAEALDLDTPEDLAAAETRVAARTRRTE